MVVPIVMALLVLHPLAGGDFISWDDLDTVARNPLLNPALPAGLADHWTRQQGHLYIPVTYSTWHVVAMLTQASERDELGQALQGWVFSSLNLLVHLVSVALVSQVLLRLTRSGFAAIAGATLFAIHPLQVEAVGWISGLKDLLGTLFMLAAVLVFLPAAGPLPDAASAAMARRRIVLLFLLSAAAMLAKPTAMVLPAVLLVMDVLLLRRRVIASLRIVAPMFVLLSIPTAIVTRLVQQSGHVDTLVPLVQRPLVALDSLAFYLGKLVWPTSLTIDYGRTPRSVIDAGFHAAWLVPPALMLVAALVYRRAPWMLAGLLVALLPLTPVLGLVPFDFQYISGVADHYAYPAMFGVALLLAFTLQHVATRPAPVAVVLIAAFAPLAWLAYRQSQVWQDTPSLMQHAMSVRPDSWLAANNLASHRLDRLPPDDSPDLLPALQDAEQLARRAISLRVHYAEAYNNLGYALYRQSRIAADEPEKRRLLREAAVAIRESLRLEPRDLSTLVNAAEISGYRGALDESAGDLPSAIKWLDASIDTFQRVLEIDPSHAYAFRRLEEARAYRKRLAGR